MKNLTLMTFIVSIMLSLVSCDEKKDRIKDQGKNDEEYLHEKMADEESESEEKPVKPVGGYEYYEEQSLKEEVKIKKETLNLLVDEYLKLKNALVNSENEKAVSYSQNIVDIIDTLEKKKALFPISEAAFALTQSRDMADKRAAFYPVSSLYASLLSYNEMGRTLYKQYCPMAFDNKGAYWISENSEIKNPYFGDRMLNCGETKKQFK